MAVNDTIESILAAAPDVPGYGGGKWAVYGMCCWWTSIPEHAGMSPPRPSPFSGNPISIPCCPSCMSPLYQARLEDFIAASVQGHPAEILPKFLLAHDSVPCHRNWMDY